MKRKFVGGGHEIRMIYVIIHVFIIILQRFYMIIDASAESWPGAACSCLLHHPELQKSPRLSRTLCLGGVSNYWQIARKKFPRLLSQKPLLLFKTVKTAISCCCLHKGIFFCFSYYINYRSVLRREEKDSLRQNRDSFFFFLLMIHASCTSLCITLLDLIWR